MWLSIFYALTVILCSLCLIGCIFVAQNATRESESVRRRLRSLELRTESAERSLEEWTQTTTDIVNRVKMMKVRGAANHSSGARGEPDAKSDPEAWRAWKNQQLRTGVIN